MTPGHELPGHPAYCFLELFMKFVSSSTARYKTANKENGPSFAVFIPYAYSYFKKYSRLDQSLTQMRDYMMFIQSHAAGIKHGGPQLKTYYAPLKKDLSSAHLSRHSYDELTIALLDPCLTLEEATLQARLQQHHPRD